MPWLLAPKDLAMDKHFKHAYTNRRTHLRKTTKKQTLFQLNLAWFIHQSYVSFMWVLDANDLNMWTKNKQITSIKKYVVIMKLHTN